MRPSRLLAVSCLLVSCGGGGDHHGSAADAAPDTGGDGEEDAGQVELAFAGIETAAWDGADGLIATWGAATGDLAIGYVLFVESLATGSLIEEETNELEAHVDGLEDGEYRLRVEARIEG